MINFLTIVVPSISDPPVGSPHSEIANTGYTSTVEIMTCVELLDTCIIPSESDGALKQFLELQKLELKLQAGRAGETHLNYSLIVNEIVA